MLRTLAVVTVVLVHFDGFPLKGSLAGSAVDLFFVLSAVLVSRPLLYKYQTRQRADLGEFYIKRFTKILPSYYFFILLGTGIAFLFIKPISPENVIQLSELPQYLFFYRNLAGPPPRMTFEHVWSLCVEEQFYIILPVVFFIAQRRFNFGLQKLIYALLAVALAGVFFKVQALFTDFAEWPTYTHNRIDAFAWGILTLILLQSSYAQNNAQFKKLQPYFLVSGLVVLAGFLTIDYAQIDPHELVLRIVSPICWVLIIIGSYHYKVRYAQVYKQIALYSYNLYLWHFLFIIPVVHYIGTGLAGCVAYMALSVGCAVLATHLIENKFLKYRTPLRRALRQVSLRKAKRQASSTTA